MPTVLPLALILALALAGCGDRTSISNGGRVSGTTLTVYSLLPREGPRAAAAADIVRGEKLALAQAGGKAGGLVVNFASVTEPVGPGGEADPAEVAAAIRELIRDQSLVAVIGDLDAGTARVTVPLLNATGILHLSPGTGATAFGEPAGSQTFVPLVPLDAVQATAIARAARGEVAIEAEGSETAQALADAVAGEVGATVDTADADTVVYAGSDPVNALGVVEGVLEENPKARVLLGQELSTTDLPERLRKRTRVRFLTAAPATEPPGFDAAFARAYPGVARGPMAVVGWRAMREVLATLRSIGTRAQSRQAVIDAYLATDPRRRADAQPFRLVPQGR